MIPGLKKLVDAVHNEGGKIFFQIGHSGRQTTKKMCGQKPVAPSSFGRDPINFVKPKEMNELEIEGKDLLTITREAQEVVYS
jgi:2,4-dienoyl-CoA reductase-like NADH-dependent reductase (Old Yellow Enzyme family)